MEHDVFGLPNGKFPGATEHLKRWSKRKYSCSISSKLSLIPVSGLRGRFPVNVTDAYKC